MHTRQAGGERTVVTGNGPANLRVHHIGPHPILVHFLNRMEFLSIVSSSLARTRDGWIEHAQTLSALVQNIILSPAPLYRIASWAEPVDAKAMGLTDAEKKALNDDRVARALDSLVSQRARNLFFRMAVHIIEQFELETERIHHDTTTVTFHGRYETSNQPPRITQGHNKDHRPDLKQLVFGLNVTSDGAVPISHDIFSGNRTDDTVHRDNIHRLREILDHDDFIYVADSKLCTEKNLSYIAGYGGKFVTVMPRTRNEDKEFRRQLRKSSPKVRWRKTLVIESKRRKSDPPDIYWTTSDGINQSKEGYRIIWCKSSQKTELDAQVRETQLSMAKAELFDLGTRLNKGKFKTRESIKKSIDAILEKTRCTGLLDVKIGVRDVITTRRLRRGRPGLNDPVREIRTKHFHLGVKRDRISIRAESRQDGVFPLLTNLSTKPRKEIILIYKYQPYIEKRHSLFKTELGVHPVYIKKPHRAVGLVHATFLAMMLDALIERTIRLAMVEEGIQSLPIYPEGRPSRTPTTARVLEMFSDVAWYEYERGDEAVLFPVQLSTLQRDILRLLGMDESAYA